MTNQICIELCHGSSVREFTMHDSVETALEQLSTQTVNGFRYRLAPPSEHGANDEERYSRQCELLGIENVYA